MRIIGLLLVWCLSSVAQAVVVSDLYQVRVPVQDQTTAVRQSALQEALQLALVKVAGVREVTQQESIQARIGNPDVYVKSFRYVRQETDASLWLEVSFAQNLIDELLRTAQQPIWGKSRPLILMWQAVEESRERRILSQSTETWRAPFEQAMSERGLPLLWPVQDMEDQMALPPGSLWGLFREDIRRASERYMADAQLAGRLVPVVDGYAYRGFLQHQGETLELSAEAVDTQTVLRQVADQVASFMAQKYAVRNDGDQTGQMIMVSGVGNFRQYHDLLAYLNANVAINRVHVRSADQQNLMLELELATDWSQVWSMLALDRRLHTTEQPLVYHWQP